MIQNITTWILILFSAAVYAEDATYQLGTFKLQSDLPRVRQQFEDGLWDLMDSETRQENSPPDTVKALANYVVWKPSLEKSLRTEPSSPQEAKLWEKIKEQNKGSENLSPLEKLGKLAVQGFVDHACYLEKKKLVQNRIPGATTIWLAFREVEELKRQNPALDLEPLYKICEAGLRAPEVRPHVRDILELGNLPFWPEWKKFMAQAKLEGKVFVPAQLAPNSKPKETRKIAGVDIDPDNDAELRQHLTQALAHLIDTSGEIGEEQIARLSKYVGWDPSMSELPVKGQLLGGQPKIWEQILLKAKPQWTKEPEAKMLGLARLLEQSVEDMERYFKDGRFPKDSVPGFLGILLAINDLERLRALNPDLDLTEITDRTRKALDKSGPNAHLGEYAQMSDSEIWQEIVRGAKAAAVRRPVQVAQVEKPKEKEPAEPESEAEREPQAAPILPITTAPPLELVAEPDLHIPPPFWIHRSDVAFDEKRRERILELFSLVLEYDTRMMGLRDQATSDLELARFSREHRNAGVTFPGIRFGELNTNDGTKVPVAIPPLGEEYRLILRALTAWKDQSRIEDPGFKFKGFRGPKGREYAVFMGRLAESPHQGETAVLFVDPRFPTGTEWHANADGTLAKPRWGSVFEEAFQLYLLVNESDQIWYRQPWSRMPGFEIQPDPQLSTPDRPAFQLRLADGDTTLASPLTLTYGNSFAHGGSSGRLSWELSSIDRALPQVLTSREKFQNELHTRELAQFERALSQQNRRNPSSAFVPENLAEALNANPRDFMHFNGFVSKIPMAWETGSKDPNALLFDDKNAIVVFNTGAKHGVRWQVHEGENGIRSWVTEQVELEKVSRPVGWDAFLLESGYQPWRTGEIARLRESLQSHPLNELKDKLKQSSHLQKAELELLQMLLEKEAEKIRLTDVSSITEREARTKLLTISSSDELGLTLSVGGRLFIWRRSSSGMAPRIVGDLEIPTNRPMAATLSSDGNYVAFLFPNQTVQVYPTVYLVGGGKLVR